MARLPAPHHGPVCAINCPHESCLMIACPRLFVTITRAPATRTEKGHPS